MKIPPTQTFRHDDGSIEVRVGDVIGTVSSDHLVEPKAHQLQAAWLRLHDQEQQGGEPCARD